VCETRLVIVQQIQLDGVIARPIEKMLIDYIGIVTDAGHILYAKRVLEHRGLKRQYRSNRRFCLRRSIGPKLVFAKATHAAGVETFALVSAIGAATNSMSFYAKTKGEIERDIQRIGFRSLTVCRPSIIAGERSEMRIAEGAVLAISRILAPILPKKLHINPASVIAASLLDSVLAAKAGCRWIFSEELNEKRTTSPIFPR
jgi:hypothetical protein